LIRNVLEKFIDNIFLMQIKLKDVARATGYSITTVSRALAGYSDVAVETRGHILAEPAGAAATQPIDADARPDHPRR
jgi:hypothetical protein